MGTGNSLRRLHQRIRESLWVYQSPERLRHDDANVRDAVRFSAIVVVVGIAFLITAAVWVSTCSGATADTVAWGASARTACRWGAGDPVGRRASCLLPHLSDVAQARHLVGMARRWVGPHDIDASGTDDEHASTRRDLRCSAVDRRDAVAVDRGGTGVQPQTQSSSELMAEHVCERLRAAGVKTESLRCADYAISPGVQADMGDGDEWPKIREKLLNADILVSPARRAEVPPRDAGLNDVDEVPDPVASTTAAAARNTAHLANVLREQRYPSYQ